MLDPLFYNFDWLSVEPKVHEWLKKNLKEGMTFFDVGAWVGSYSLVAAKWAGPSGHVVSFEPSDVARRLLERHIGMNRFSERIRVVDAAVGDEDGETTFYVLSDSLEASNSIAFRQDLVGIERAKLCEVRKPIMQLDTFVDINGLVPDIIKIDVEGAEVSVLRGATKMLLSNRPMVICSLHPDWLPGLGDSLENFFDLVDEIGYEAFDFDGRKRHTAGLEEILLLPRASTG